MTCLLTAAVQGKIAWLPAIYSLRGQELSALNRAQVQPLFGFLDDAASLFQDYAEYRKGLASFVRANVSTDTIDQLRDCTLEQFLDLVHGIGLVRELDPGPLNYMVQRALGAPNPPIPFQSAWPGWVELGKADVVHQSAVAGRGYVWREQVCKAEPKAEITISNEEIARVERQIEHYLL
jgi:hypothetical protein